MRSDKPGHSGVSSLTQSPHLEDCITSALRAMASSVAAVSSEDHHAEIQPHLIRITNHGKIQAWVAFALEFFKKNDGRPLVLHTLPASKPTAKELPAPTAPGGEPTSHVSQGKCSSTSTIPRLITVVEIIKREYLKTLKLSKLSGLHQYNEIGYLEDLQDNASGESRTNALVLALEGKNHLVQKQTPFMRVTLCQSTLPILADKGATYQQPAVRKLSKSAKKRIKKRMTDATAGDGPG